MAVQRRFVSATRGEVGMDTKKSAARAAKDVRTTTTRSADRSQILTKRSSMPPAEASSPSKRPSAPANDVSAKEASAKDASARDASKKARGSSLPPARASSLPPRASSVPPAVRASVPAQAADNDNAKKPASPPRARLPTGSLHTEARVPAEAETIKQRLTALVNVQQKLSELKRSSQKHFYEIGELLHRIREQRLFEVKGYGSFEAFLEREVNLGTQFCLQSVRIFETFQPAVAHQHGLARLAAALEALDGGMPAAAVNGEVARGARSPIPPHKL